MILRTCVGLFIVFILSAAGNDFSGKLLTGVPHDLAQHYSGSGNPQFFLCFDKSRQIPASKVNDNYCDCPCGSDEPGTSACAGHHGLYTTADLGSPKKSSVQNPLKQRRLIDLRTASMAYEAGVQLQQVAVPSEEFPLRHSMVGSVGFWCENKDFAGHYIPSSFVGDGVCDCCDGSDEAVSPSLIVCQNSCAKLAQNIHKRRSERQATFERSRVARDEAIQLGKDAVAKNKERLSEITPKLDLYRELEQQMRREEEIEASEASKIRQEAEQAFISFLENSDPAAMKSAVEHLTLQDGTASADVSCNVWRSTKNSECPLNQTYVQELINGLNLLKSRFGDAGQAVGLPPNDGHATSTIEGEEYDSYGEDEDADELEWSDPAPSCAIQEQGLWLYTSVVGSEVECKTSCVKHRQPDSDVAAETSSSIHECNGINYHSSKGECSLWHIYNLEQPTLTCSGFNEWTSWVVVSGTSHSKRAHFTDENSDDFVEETDSHSEENQAKKPALAQKSPSSEAEEILEMIADPQATKPEHWDDEMDGVWEAPRVLNPAYRQHKESMLNNKIRDAILVSSFDQDSQLWGKIAAQLVQRLNKAKWILDFLKPSLQGKVEITVTSPEEIPAHTRPEAEKARTEYHQIESEKQQAENDLREIQTVNALDFGPEHEYYTLRGQCFSKEHGGENYEMCPFGDSKQGWRSIGKFAGWHQVDQWHSKYGVMRFSDGEAMGCPQPRSLDVVLQCGEHAEVVKIEEPLICHYEMTFKCPAACDPNK